MRTLIEAAMISSNNGARGRTTKSSAPVINTVRWPTARCSRMRRMPAGKTLGEDQLAEELDGILVDAVDGGAFVAAVEEAEKVAAVLAIEREQRRCFAQGLQHVANAVVVRNAMRREP